MSWGGYNLFLTPAHDWIHDCILGLDPGLDPGVGFSLEYECSVTQSPPGGYSYDKWWGDAPILRAKPSRGGRLKVETLEGRIKALFPCFRLSRIFGFTIRLPSES